MKVPEAVSQRVPLPDAAPAPRPVPVATAVARSSPTPGPAATANPTPTRMVPEVDQRARLFRAVEKLPDDQRRVVHMRFAEGQSIREIAQELGRSEGAVKQLQFRALQTLRANVEGAHA